MYTTYRLHADELAENFIKAVKQTFKDRNIEIIVQEVQDETEYLLSSQANKEHLLRSIQNVANHTNLVKVQMEEL
ncbi:MAG: hypothetical protein LC641_04735 [Spirochaeta sp.]|nr:hypothetical protein [Spirochaeta sp.]